MTSRSKRNSGAADAAPEVTAEQAAAVASRIMEQAPEQQTSFGAVVVRDSVRNAAPGTLVSGRVITGWDYADLGPIERGQMFRLRGERGDEKLVRLGYVEVFDPRTMPRPVQCRLCPKEFKTERDLVGHGESKHIEPARKITPQEEDVLAEKADRRIEKGETPLYMEKTAASLGA